MTYEIDSAGIEYKHLVEVEGRDHFYDVSLIVSRMHEEFPASSKSRGASYEEIAYRWLYVMPFKVIGLRHYNPDKHRNLIQIPVRSLRDHFNYRYNRRQNYWFDWFQQNYPLYMIQQMGNSYTGNSMGMPLTYVIEGMLKADAETYTAAFEQEQDQEHNIDAVPVDLDNLYRYIQSAYDVWKRRTKESKYYDKISQNCIDAIAVYKLAQGYNETTVCNLTGKTTHWIPQTYTTAHSGRRYYTGSFAVQAMSSEVRSAVLGACWSIDLNTSVYAFYKLLGNSAGVDTTIITQMQINKSRFRAELAKCIQNIQASEHAKTEMIKRAITALGFGANSDHFGAINDIIRNREDRDAVYAHEYWVELVQLQQSIEQWLRVEYADEIKQHQQDYKTHNPEKRWNIKKFMAHFYQTYETNLMNIAIAELESKQVLLWVHDGCYTKHKPDLAINHSIQQINPHASFEVERVESWRAPVSEVELEEIEHKQRMAEQQRIAEQQYGKNSAPSLSALRMNNATDNKTVAQHNDTGYYNGYYSGNSSYGE